MHTIIICMREIVRDQLNAHWSTAINAPNFKSIAYQPLCRNLMTEHMHNHSDRFVLQNSYLMTMASSQHIWSLGVSLRANQSKCIHGFMMYHLVQGHKAPCYCIKYFMSHFLQKIFKKWDWNYSWCHESCKTKHTLGPNAMTDTMGFGWFVGFRFEITFY